MLETAVRLRMPPALLVATDDLRRADTGGEPVADS
jgi:hypothetical protein